MVNDIPSEVSLSCTQASKMLPTNCLTECLSDIMYLKEARLTTKTAHLSPPATLVMPVISVRTSTNINTTRTVGVDAQDSICIPRSAALKATVTVVPIQSMVTSAFIEKCLDKDSPERDMSFVALLSWFSISPVCQVFVVGFLPAEIRPPWRPPLVCSSHLRASPLVQKVLYAIVNTDMRVQNKGVNANLILPWNPGIQSVAEPHHVQDDVILVYAYSAEQSYHKWFISLKYHCHVTGHSLPYYDLYGTRSTLITVGVCSNMILLHTVEYPELEEKNGLKNVTAATTDECVLPLKQSQFCAFEFWEEQPKSAATTESDASNPTGVGDLYIDGSFTLWAKMLFINSLMQNEYWKLEHQPLIGPKKELFSTGKMSWCHVNFPKCRNQLSKEKRRDSNQRYC